MTAADVAVVLPVAFDDLDGRWVGERLLVAHRLGTCSRTDGMTLPKGHRDQRCKHLAGVSDVKVPDVPDGRPLTSKVLYLGGEWVLVTADDVVVAALNLPELDIEPDGVGTTDGR